MSRMIWVNTGLPPVDPQPSYAKGKTPGTDVTHAQLHRRKVEALKLLLSFVFATKHYLRGEDGVNYADYQGVLPASFARFDEVGYTTQRASSTGTYQAIRSESMATSHDGSGRTTPDLQNRPDATKRVRPKRSKQQLPDHTTPLLQENHRTVEFHAYADEASLPLPLVYLYLSFLLLPQAHYSYRIAHELSHRIYGFRKDGFLETVGPAGLNAFTQMWVSLPYSVLLVSCWLLGYLRLWNT